MSNANDPQAQTGNETQQEGAEAPQYVTTDQIAQIVNSAVTSQLGRALKTQLGGAIEAALQPIKEKLATAPPTTAAEKAERDHKQSPEFVALQKQLAELKTAYTATQEEAARERRKAREDSAFSTLMQSLSGKVKPGTEKIVATLLKAEGRLQIGDDGTPSLRVRTSLLKGQAEDDHDFPIADGVGQYLKTSEAALFLPPPTTTPGNATPRQPLGALNTTPIHNGSQPMSREDLLRKTVEDLSRLGVAPNI